MAQSDAAEPFSYLRSLAFFREFSDADLREVLRFSAWRQVGRGEVLMREGEDGSEFCVLADGAVQVTKQGQLLNVLSPGECFGEMAYLMPDRSTRTADVTVLSDARVVTIATQALAAASQAVRHGFDRAFLRILVERLDQANTRLTSAVL